jgi:putative component of toxin-antitoxin plasmid stabilization module
LCANELKSLKPQSMIPPGDENACIGIKYWLEDKIKYASDLPLKAGFPMVVTYSMGGLMREILQELPYSPHLIVRDVEGKRLPIDCFNPASEGPVGSAALRAFSKSLDLLLKSSILEDTLFDLSSGSPLIQGHDHPSFDVIKLAAIRSAPTPWDICKSPLLFNMSLLAELSGGGELAEQTVDRVMGNPRRLLSNSFKDDLEEMNTALLTKEIRKRKNVAPSNSAASTAVDTADTPTPVEILTEKQRFFRALQGGTGETIDLRAFSKTYAGLYSAYKRGFVSLTECLDLVRSGSKVAPTPESSKPCSASLAVPDAREKPGTLPATNGAPLVENYEIQGYNSPWFQKWLTTIPAREQRLINKRLDCARKGQFLDHLQLRHDSRLFEFRFHLGEGKRIIFSFSAENEITLHAAGSKKDQNSMIIAASNALDEKNN